jgi:hypothetical protein
MGSGTDWLPVLLSGAVGSAIGTIGAFSAAIVVVKRQAEADRRLAAETREALALDGAIQGVAEVHQRALQAITSSGRDPLLDFVGWLISSWADIAKRVGRVSDDLGKRMGAAFKELVKRGSDFDVKDTGAMKDDVSDFANALGGEDGMLSVLFARQREYYRLPERQKKRWLPGKKGS